MKKLLILASLAPLLVAAPAYAATIAVTPATVSVTAGQSVTLTLTAQAGSDTLVTLEADLSYPANLLEPTAFTLAPTWVPIVENGYDQMSDGMLIKTGGYPGGFTGSQAFGTITFTALSAGTATVAVTASSSALDENGAEALAGAQGSSIVAVSSAAPAQSAGTPGSTATSTGTANGQNQSQSQNQTSANTLSTSTTNTVDQAAAAGLLGGFHIPSWVWMLIVLVILVIAGGAWWRWGNKKV